MHTTKVETRPVIRMVVIDEHTLGYMDEGARFANALSASVLKGATWTCPMSSGMIFLDGRNVRTATRKDFDEFRVVVDGYLRDDNVFKYVIAD